jgi:hypothetical protein
MKAAQIDEYDEARITFILSTAPWGISVDNILRNMRKTNSTLPIDTLQSWLERQAEAGAIRRFDHPVREGEYLYGCLRADEQEQ